MSRVLLFYERRDAAAWLAHLDTMRLFERAFSRARWPLAWTEDAFNPRPQIVFALPVGVGIETRRDPVEVGLSDTAFELSAAVDCLNHTLVDGVRIVEAGWADDAGPSLMARVSGARYRLEAGGIEQAFRTTFRPGREVVMTRQRKGRRTSVELSSKLFAFEGVSSDAVILTAGAGSCGHLRIDLLLEALVRDGGLTREAALGVRVVRLEVLLDGLFAGQGIMS